jgi:hypothetical protein
MKSFLSRAEVQELSSLLKHFVPTMYTDSITSLVTSLATLRVFESSRRKHGHNNHNNHVTRRSFKEKELILQRTSQLIDRSHDRELPKLLSAMARLDTKLSDLQSSSILVRKMKQNARNMDGRGLTDSLWALGNMHLRWTADTLDNDCKRELLSALETNIQRMNAFQITSVLWSISKIGIKWEFLSNSLQKQTVNKLLKISNQLSYQQSSKILWCLGLMRVRAVDLPRKFLNSLFASVQKTTKNTNLPLSVSQTLMGLAKMGYTWDVMDKDIQRSICTKLVSVCANTTDRSAANMVWAMGAIGLQSGEVSQTTTEAIMSSVSRAIADCTAWELSNVIWGLAKMNYKWHTIPSDVRRALMHASVRVSESANGVDVAVVMWSLGTMSAPFDTMFSISEQRTLQYTFVSNLLMTMLRTLPEMKPQEIAKAIYGLGETGLSWNALPATLKWSLNVSLRRVALDMKFQDAANCAYGLTVLAFDAEDTSDPAFRGAHEALLEAVSVASRRYFSQKARIKAQTQALLDDEEGQLPDEYAHSAHKNVDGHEVGEGALGNADTVDSGDSVDFSLQMRVESQSKRAALMTSFPNSDSNLFQLRTFAHYLDAMFFVPDRSRIPRELLDSAEVDDTVPRPKMKIMDPNNPAIFSDPEVTSMEWVNNLPFVSEIYESLQRKDPALEHVKNSEVTMKSISQLQAKIFASLAIALQEQLEDSHFQLVQEVSVFDGVFPVDAAVYRNGDIVSIVEVDGPHHYRFDGKLRRKDRLKELLYARKYPCCSFHRVRWDEVGDIGENVLAEELAAAIIENAQTINPLSKAVKVGMRQIGEFFSWGLRNDDSFD